MQKKVYNIFIFRNKEKDKLKVLTHNHLFDFYLINHLFYLSSFNFINYPYIQISSLQIKICIHKC